jgi:hypothetical protein
MRTLLMILAIGLFSIPLHAQQLKQVKSATKAPQSLKETDLPAPEPAAEEQPLELEDWMLGPFGRKDLTLAECIEVAEEPPLRLEKWMYSCMDWNIEIRIPVKQPGPFRQNIYLALP